MKLSITTSNYIHCFLHIYLTETFPFPIVIGIVIGTGGGGILVVASILKFVLCIIRVKKMNVNAKQSGSVVI